MANHSMKIKIKFVILALCFLSTNPLFADVTSDWRPGISLSAGPAWSAPGTTQTLYLQADLPQTFVANTATQVFGDSELFVNAQHQLMSHVQAQWGIALAGTSYIPLTGDIWQDAEPDFNNLSYYYKIKHTHVAAKGKLLVDAYSWVYPYLSGSVAVGFNRASQYTNTAHVYEVVAPPAFASHTTTAFTYTVGAGLQRELDHHWSIGLGYEFSDWGKTTLAAATGQLSDQGLNLNHVYTNQLQFSINLLV